MNDLQKDKMYILVAGGFVVLIAGHFYAPWEDNTLDLLKEFFEEEDILSMKLIFIRAFFPLLMTYLEAAVFIAHYIKMNVGIIALLYVCVAFWFYIFVSITVERYIKKAEHTSLVQAYIENLCLENVAMYVANIVVYELIKKLESIYDNQIIIIILIIIVYIITMWALLFFILYIMIWLMFIIAPIAILFFLPVHLIVFQIMAFLVMVLVQILWQKYVSKFFFYKLFKVFTLERLGGFYES